MARSADFKRLAQSGYTLAFVNVINTIAEPYAAVAIISLYRFHSNARVGSFNALCCDLVARLIAYGLAIFKGQTVVVGELFECSNVNHMYYLFSFDVYIIPHFRENVNSQNKQSFKQIFVQIWA